MSELLFQKAKLIEHLDAMAEVLQTDGWCRWTIKDEDGCHCLMGAHVYAGERDDPERPDWFSIYTVLGFRSGGDATYWNDYTAKDKDAVLNLLKDAATRIQQTA